jgi:hypothetical protein
LREVLIDKKRTHFRNWIERKIERLWETSQPSNNYTSGYVVIRLPPAS